MFKKSYIRRSWSFFLRSICPWRFCGLLPSGGECFLSQCLGVSLLNMQLGRSAYLITLLNQVIVLVVLCHRCKKQYPTENHTKCILHTHVLNSVSLVNSSPTWQALSCPYVWKWNGTSRFLLISQRCHCVFQILFLWFMSTKRADVHIGNTTSPLFGRPNAMWQALSALSKAFGETWRPNTCGGFCGRWELEMVKWPWKIGWFPYKDLIFGTRMILGGGFP